MFFNKLVRKYRSLALTLEGALLSDTIQCKGRFFEGIAKGFKCGKAIFLQDGVKLILSNKHTAKPELKIGDYFFMNYYSVIDCHLSITIGSRVQIGPHCYISDFDHDLRVDVRQPFHRGTGKAEAVVIKDNVWIGAGVIVLKGVTIGKNSVIGAGSVVTKNIPDNAVAIGIPAKVIKTIEGNQDKFDN